jgi:hypothetical protein
MNQSSNSQKQRSTARLIPQLQTCITITRLRKRHIQWDATAQSILWQPVKLFIRPVGMIWTRLTRQTAAIKITTCFARVTSRFVPLFMLFFKGTDTYNQLTAEIACDGGAVKIATQAATTQATATPTSGGVSKKSLLSFILGFSIIILAL